MFSSDRRRERAAEKAVAAKVADRVRIEEALAPYEHAVAMRVRFFPAPDDLDVIDLHDSIDLRDAPERPTVTPLRRRRNRPLVYGAAPG